MRATLFASACAAAVAVFLPAQAMAAIQAQPEQPDNQEDSTTVGEVIVTATRREERLQDVPLAVTTYSQEELNERGIVGYEGLAIETPGVVLNRPTANFNNFTARGIATNGYGANLQSTVAVYIDELPISANGNSTILDPSLYDVERIEFLRGPQGTLFGSGSLAGALRILTHDPDPTGFGASVLVDFGLTEEGSLRQRYNGMVNVPLIENELALRLVGFVRNEDGWVDNVGTGVENSNRLVQYGGRAILQWEPTERFTTRLMYSHEISNPRDSSLTNPLRGIDVRSSDRPDRFTSDMENFNATFEYQFDGARLTSSTTYGTYNQRFYVDLAGTFGGAIAFALDADAYDDNFVHESRIVSDAGGRIDWSAGVFYFRRRRDVDYGYRSNPAFLAARGITGLPDEYYQRFGVHIISNELAGFGEITYRFTPDLWITGGLRYGTTDAQGFTEAWGYSSDYLIRALFGIPGPVTVTGITPATGVVAEETGPSYRLSLSWRPVPSITTYAAVATGFRPPIVNARAGAVSTLDPTDIVIPYGASSDNLLNYEVGIKGNWFDRRLFANIALYYIDWNDIQVQANRVSDSVQFATNIGEATSKGIEFEMIAYPFTGWTVALNGSFNQAEVTALTPQEAGFSGAVLGARLAGPEFQGSLRITYDWELQPGVDANASVAIAHVDDFPNAFPNTPGRPTVPLATYDNTDEYTFVNANLAVAFDQVTVGAYIENVFNDRSVTYVHPEAFLDARYARVRPRTVGVRIGYEF
ncbi:TonB-dependent receptor [Brevundimonas sp.]|uniref:TonB-dependent receptor n=1 Tax=Brevundimonas sp. TaxID=1871086 RepID=UPI0025D72DE3|nr:TonB-dependent receptor [Brevundimonas sp.]